MEPILLIDQEIFLNKVPTQTVNLLHPLTVDYVGALVNSSMPPMPDVTRSADQMVGDGNERAQRLRKGWVIPWQHTVSGLLNTETAARFGGRNLGGTRAASGELAVGSGAYDITWNMQTKAQGRIPKMSSLGWDLGGYKFVFPSVAVNTFEIAFEGEQDVTFSAGLINPGLYYINDTEANLLTNGWPAAYAAALNIEPIIVPPAPPIHRLMHPAAVKVTFNDGTTTHDFAEDADLINGACSLNNAVTVEQLNGDPFILPSSVPNFRKSGAYAREIYRGTREPGARLKVKMDRKLKAFILAQNGSVITNLTYLFRSEDSIADSAYSYEYEWKCPVGEIFSVSSDPDGDKAAVTMTFYPETDAVTGGYWIQRVRTHDLTLQ